MPNTLLQAHPDLKTQRQLCQMKGYDFLHLVFVVLTLHGFAQATYRSNIKKKVLLFFQKFFQIFFLLVKKLEIEKTKPTFIISVLKVVY